MLFRKNSSSHEPRLGRQLLAHFENADAARRTIPLLPSSWKELWAVYQLSQPAPAKKEKAALGGSHRAGATAVQTG